MTTTSPALMQQFQSGSGPSAIVVIRARMTARAIRRKASRNQPRKAPQAPQAPGKGFGAA